ncbi:MAG: hypothetical protein K2W82_16070 [Candidatus Obscuribacterales bacterium]|nr:hypothetical protein [Candidatus Obscuribacterales bacterium]
MLGLIVCLGIVSSLFGLFPALNRAADYIDHTDGGFFAALFIWFGVIFGATFAGVATYMVTTALGSVFGLILVPVLPVLWFVAINKGLKLLARQRQF